MADELNINDIFGSAINTSTPEPNKKARTSPKKTKEKETNIEKSSTNKEQPVYEEKIIDSPEYTDRDKEMPPSPDDINTIFVNDEKIVIKPTKLKYFRINTIQTGKLLSVIPLGDFFAYEKGVFDKERDSDQMLYDFLIAALDDEEFVKRNYNDFTADTIDQIIKITDRLNHTEEKEERARKNREAQVANR